MKQTTKESVLHAILIECIFLALALSLRQSSSAYWLWITGAILWLMGWGLYVSSKGYSRTLGFVSLFALGIFILIALPKRKSPLKGAVEPSVGSLGNFSDWCRLGIYRICAGLVIIAFFLLDVYWSRGMGVIFSPVVFGFIAALLLVRDRNVPLEDGVVPGMELCEKHRRRRRLGVLLIWIGAILASCAAFEMFVPTSIEYGWMFSVSRAYPGAFVAIFFLGLALFFPGWLLLLISKGYSWVWASLPVFSFLLCDLFTSYASGGYCYRWFSMSILCLGPLAIICLPNRYQSEA